MFKQLTKTVATAFSTDPLKEFKLNREASVTAGRHGLFSMCEGVERSTGKLVTVFSAKRKDLVQRCGGNESEVDLLLEDMRKGITFLCQLQHPFLLRFERTLTMSGSLIYYVTERVVGYLPQMNTSKIPLQLKKLEIQHLMSAIRFLHERCSLLLLNFGPHSIYATATGWKIGDLCHCLLKNEVAGFRPIRAAAGHLISSPLMDYLADECFERPANSNNATNLMTNLFESPGAGSDGPDSFFPHSDTFSLLVTAAEILRDTKMFHSGHDIEKRRQQVPGVTRDIAALFPSVSSVCATPRPPLATLAQSASLFSEDIRLILEIERLEPAEGPKSMSFEVLKSVYEKIGEKEYCSEILQQSIIPFGLRAAKHQYMLRFVLPILMQCVVVLPKDKIHKELKDFFVMVIRGITNANSFEVTGVLAQQLLEKVNVIQDLFATPQDQSEVLLPFYIRCISSQQTGIVMLAIRALNQLLHSPTVPSIKWPPRFLQSVLSMLQSASEEVFFLLIDTTTTLLQYVSDKERYEVEGLLVKGVQTVFLAQQKRLVSVLGVLNKVQQSMPLEHVATVSIPLLSPLLLSGNADVRNYAASVITGFISKFDAHTSASIPSPNVPKGADTWVRSPAETAIDFTLPSGGVLKSSCTAGGGDDGGMAHHYDASSTVNDIFSGTNNTSAVHQAAPAKLMDNTFPLNSSPQSRSSNGGGGTQSSTAQMWGNLASQISSVPLDQFNTGTTSTTSDNRTIPPTAHSAFTGADPLSTYSVSAYGGMANNNNNNINNNYTNSSAAPPKKTNDDDLMAAFGFS